MSYDDLIPTVEAAEILKLERSTLSRWAKDGRLTIVRRLPGRTGACLYSRAEVEALRDRMAMPAGEGAA